MAHFESDAEVYDQLGGILNNLVYNSARREQLRQADAVVQFAFRQPDATVTLDVRANKRPRVDLGETKLRADIVLAMDADTGRALLTGELSPTVALARGDVRTKGPVAKVLRIVPATVGAHEVEADLEPEPAPRAAAPAAEAAAPAEDAAPEAAAEAEATAAADEAPAAEAAPAAEEAPPAEAAPAAEEAPPVDPPVEAEAPAAADAPAADEPAPATEDAAPAADPAPADDAEAAPPVDPPAEAEAPGEKPADS
jgi:putative sterol carrier protein